jgi:hypothetical protein
MDEALGLVTLDLEPMNLREALEEVDLDIGFNYDVTEDMAPQASFLHFPKKMAADVLIAAATGKPMPAMDIKSISSLPDNMLFAVGGYKIPNGMNKGYWLLTIITRQADPITLVSAMFRVTRTPFIMLGESRQPADGAGFVTAKEGTKSITVQLFDTALEDALDMIAKAADLQIERTGAAYTIKPKSNNCADDEVKPGAEKK